MATISTTIQLYDRVSAPINNMITALDNMCSAYENVEDSMSSGFNPAHIEATRQAINSASQQMVELGNNIEDNEQHQQNFNNAVHQGQSAMDGLIGKALRLTAAYMGVTKLGQMSDELTLTAARLDMMNDKIQTTPELLQMVYQSSQNARGSLNDMADVVARFGNNAKDAFSSSREVVDFANLIQKQMTIAGAGTQEASNAMLQLSQALGSGVLRGDELNSIFEQAPNLIQSIADYMDVPIGQIRAMAQEGKLSASIVKNAIFADADNINAKFEQMPMTWGQVWTMMGNAAVMKMQPVLDKINELANNQQFQTFASNSVDALVIVVGMLLTIMEIAGVIGSFIGDNWSIIEPIVMGIVTALGLYTAALILNNTIQGISAMMAGVKAAAEMMEAGATFTATAAQHGFNAALMACPLTWIILLIIAVIAAIYAVASAIAKMTGIANSGFGVITGGINVVIQFFVNLGLVIANIALGIGNAIGALCSNMMTAFHNAICNVQSWFYNLLSTALSVIAGIAEALNKLPFVEFDYSGITNAASDYAAKASEAAGNKQEYQDVGAAFNKGMSTFDAFKGGWAKDAFKTGAAWGDGVADKISGTVNGLTSGGFDTSNMVGGAGYQADNYDAGKVPGNIADTAKNTGKAADFLSISAEDLKYLHDIAEREVINKFTTAEIKIEMTNHNNVNSDMDLDGIVDHLTSSVNEAMETAARG
jgi:putative tape measure domain protein